jgi:hypothetical protein
MIESWDENGKPEQWPDSFREDCSEYTAAKRFRQTRKLIRLSIIVIGNK